VPRFGAITSPAPINLRGRDSTDDLHLLRPPFSLFEGGHDLRHLPDEFQIIQTAKALTPSPRAR
jgi:hypothetical protein